MKRKSLVLLLAVILISLNCTQDRFIKAHSLKTRDGVNIGDVYVKFINDTIFTDLFIVNQSDTLFSIRRQNLYSQKGNQTEVYPIGFYGYKFILKKDDYIVLNYLRDKGKKVSDDLTIEWNYDSKVIELQQVP